MMRNDYEIRDNEVHIFMNSKGNLITTIIDLDDFDTVNSFPNTWFPNWSQITKTFYVYGNTPTIDGKRSMITLHRLLLDYPKGKFVDHINHDTLDNRGENLRIVTNSENQRNRKQRNKNTSGYVGVSWHKHHQKWNAKITINRKQIHLGYFDNKEEAKKVRDTYVQSL